MNGLSAMGWEGEGGIEGGGGREGGRERQTHTDTEKVKRVPAGS